MQFYMHCLGIWVEVLQFQMIFLPLSVNFVLSIVMSKICGVTMHCHLTGGGLTKLTYVGPSNCYLFITCIDSLSQHTGFHRICIGDYQEYDSINIKHCQRKLKIKMVKKEDKGKGK